MNLAHEAGVLDAQTAIIRGKPKPVKTAAQALDEFAAKHAKPKPVKAPKHKHLYFRRVCKICGHKKPVRPKSERQLLEAELWDLTAKIVKARDGCCVTCGTTDKPCLSHWIKCGKQAVRYDLRNCNQQCAPCNDRHNNWTYFYDNYMLKHYGQEIMTQLTQRAIESDSKNFRWSVVELRDMVQTYKGILWGLTDGPFAEQNRELMKVRTA